MSKNDQVYSSHAHLLKRSVSDAADFRENYRLAYLLAEEIASHNFTRRGYRFDPQSAEIIDLCQSVLGEVEPLQLLRTTRFEALIYRPVLEAAMEAVRKSLYPDSARRRFVSIDASGFDLLSEETAEADSPAELNEEVTAGWLAGLGESLSSESFNYLTTSVLPANPSWEIALHRLLKYSRTNEQVEAVEIRLRLMHRFYPDGRLPEPMNLPEAAHYSETAIIDTYLMIYLGLERTFPPAFLKHDAERKCAVMVRVLIEHILERNPESVLEERDINLFWDHGLQGVYRHFNYSFNRVLHNAYTEAIPQWLSSRSDVNYWEDARNRTEAICWLVENRCNLSPELLYKHRFSKEKFSANGLSYMFNKYYNSVSRALAAAYPYLEPWQLGKVSFDYWSDENAGRAIRWMINQKGWRPAELPARLHAREFTRRTFAEFGLSTLFEKKFSRNIYRAVSIAWPNRFHPWEFGNVPAAYWRNPQHIIEASRWIAEQEGLAEDEVPAAIRSNRLNDRSLQKYSIGSALKKRFKGGVAHLFSHHLWREQHHRQATRKLLRKVQKLKRKGSSSLLEIVLYGLFYHNVQQHRRRMEQQYQRISYRIRRRQEEQPGH